jgi:hypothetical protein
MTERVEFEPSRRFPTYTSRHLLEAVETGDLGLVSMQLFWRRRCSGFRRAAFGAGDSETILKVDQFGFERGDSAGQHPLPASRRTSGFRRPLSPNGRP